MSKIDIKIFTTKLEPGAFFITDPFCANVEPIKDYDQLFVFYNKKRTANSDALFIRILTRLNQMKCYMGRQAIWNEAFKTTESRGGQRGSIIVEGDSLEIIARLSQYYYRIHDDRQGYYVIHDVSEQEALKITTAFRDAYQETLKTATDSLHALFDAWLEQ